MTEEAAKIIAMLEGLAESQPPDYILARNPHWTPEVLNIGRAMVLAAAEMVREGKHETYSSGPKHDTIN